MVDLRVYEWFYRGFTSVSGFCGAYKGFLQGPQEALETFLTARFLFKVGLSRAYSIIRFL